MEIFSGKLVLIKETRRIVPKCVLLQVFGMKKQQDIQPSNELQKNLLHQSSSTSVIHGPTASALMPRKLSFTFWSFPSFIISSLQCKTGKSKQCLWSLYYGHDYLKPHWEYINTKEPTTSIIHCSISPSIKENAIWPAAICPISDPVFLLSQGAVDSHVQSVPHTSIQCNMLACWGSSQSHTTWIEA